MSDLAGFLGMVFIIGASTLCVLMEIDAAKKEILKAIEEKKK